MKRSCTYSFPTRRGHQAPAEVSSITDSFGTGRCAKGRLKWGHKLPKEVGFTGHTGTDFVVLAAMMFEAK